MTVPITADRIKETTHTVGTGSLALDGAVTGFSSFSSFYPDSGVMYYSVTDGTNYEIGSGQYLSNALHRFPLVSTNSNNLVSFGAGVKEVFATYMGKNSVYTASGFSTFQAPQASGLAFWASSQILNYDSNAVWDAVNHRLGILTAPQYAIDIGGAPAQSTIRASGSIVGVSGVTFIGSAPYSGGQQLEPFFRNKLDNSASGVLSLSSLVNQTIGFQLQQAGTIFAGPPSGCPIPSNCSPGIPTFRALTLYDLPDLSTTYASSSGLVALSGWVYSVVVNAPTDTALSGWVSGTLANIPSAASISGWAFSTFNSSGTNISGWTNTTIVNLSGWVSGSLLNAGNTSAVSGWAKSTIDNSGNLISGWVSGSLVNAGNTTAVSGWAKSTIDNSGALVSGWAQSTFTSLLTLPSGAIVSGDNAVSGWASGYTNNQIISVSGWTNSRDNAVSGWIFSTLNSSGTNISGWAATNATNAANTAANNVSGWILSTLNSSGTNISGWTKATIDNSGNLISGWAQNTFTSLLTMPSGAIVSGDAAISGWANSTINNVSGWNKAYTDAAVTTASGYSSWNITNGSSASDAVTNSQTVYISGISGIQIDHIVGSKILQVSASPISGWVSSTITNSGNSLNTSINNISGWTKSTIDNSGNAISGWAQNTFTSLLTLPSGAIVSGDNAVSGWASGYTNNQITSLSGWVASLPNAGSVSGWIKSTLDSSGNNLTTSINNVSGWAFSTLNNSGTNISGWVSTSITNSQNAVSGAVSGWAQATFTSLLTMPSGAIVSGDAAVSGWASGYTNNQIISVSGWATSRDNAVSGWIKSTLDSSGNNLTTTINNVSGWALSTLNSSGTNLSGWASSSITNGDNAVSGWAKSIIDSSGNLISGWTQNSLTSLSGWALSTLNASGTNISGWTNTTINNVSGWALSTINNSGSVISGWVVNHVDTPLDFNRTNLLSILGAFQAANTTEFNTIDDYFPATGMTHAVTTALTSSSFCGFGSTIGTPSGSFDRVEADLFAFNNNLFPTEARMMVRSVDSSGTILADRTIGINPTDAVNSFRCVWDLGTTVTPTGNIWVSVFCNGNIAIRTTSINAFPSSIYPVSRYTTSPTINGTGPVLGTTQAGENYWFRYSSAGTYNYQNGTLGAVTGSATNQYGYGGPVGTPQNFDRVEFDILPWNGTIFPTICRCRVFNTDQSGVMLAEKTVKVTPNIFYTTTTPYRVVVDLDYPIVNSGALNLWVDFHCDGVVGTRTLVSDTYPTASGYTAGAKATTAYSLTMTATPTWTSLSPNAQPFFSISKVPLSFYRFKGADDVTNLYRNFVAKINRPKLLIPLNQYIVVGHEWNVYLDNITKTRAYGYRPYEYTITNTFGRLESQRWTYTPGSGDIGTNTWALNAWSDNIRVAYVPSNLIVKGGLLSSGVTRKVLTIGDSTWGGGGAAVLAEVDNLCNFNRSSPGNISTLTSSSTTATATTFIPHGLASGNSITVYGADLAQYNVTQNCNVTGDSTFTYTIASASGIAASQAVLNTPIAFSSGPDNLTVTWMGTITPSAANCVDAQGNVRTSGVRTEAVTGKTFAYYYSNASSPFVNSGSFDFANYLTTTSQTMSSNDWVLFNLGINDMTSLLNLSDQTTEAAIAVIILDITNMITNIKAAVSGVRIGIALTIPPAQDQDAFGNSASVTITRFRYRQNRDMLVSALLQAFDNIIANVYIIPYGMNLDTWNNMQTHPVYINNRNTKLTSRQSDDVHPASGGYYQLADALYFFLRGNET